MTMCPMWCGNDLTIQEFRNNKNDVLLKYCACGYYQLTNKPLNDPSPPPLPPAPNGKKI